MADPAASQDKVYDGPDIARTRTGTGASSEGEDHSHPQIHPHAYQRPKGLVGLYTNTVTQVAMLGVVCFMCPGLFNALNGLGGGGQLDHMTSANANSALYATFAFFAFFAGCVL